MKPEEGTFCTVSEIVTANFFPCINIHAKLDRQLYVICEINTLAAGKSE
jgi:hypothetical protein